MSNGNQYKWLLVVEGNSDRRAYETLLLQERVEKSDFRIFSAHGKGHVLNADTWDTIIFEKETLFKTIRMDFTRRGFRGIILIVDADEGGDFSHYVRSTALPYATPDPPAPVKKSNNQYWHVDTLVGAREVLEIPVYGVVVPHTGAGCLETDLLASYGFPVAGQPEYAQFEAVIQRAGDTWGIPKHGDGKYWWEENQKAKMDKFMYSALQHGFEISGEIPSPPSVPPVITAITAAMNAHGPV